jgi:hypothetical protein
VRNNKTNLRGMLPGDTDFIQLRQNGIFVAVVMGILVPRFSGYYCVCVRVCECARDM